MRHFQFPDAQDRDEMTFNILDHGYVKYIGHMGTDATIIEAARMSTGKGFVSWNDYEECERCKVVRIVDGNEEITCDVAKDGVHVWKVKNDASLLDFMWRNKHATPFEMCELAIEVQAPIMVFREWMRSRTQSYSEFSARYSEMPNLHYVPEAERFLVKTSANKQEASVAGDGELITTREDGERVRDSFMREQSDVYAQYDWALGRGVPKEVARVNTPISRYSKMRAKTDLRNWLWFLNLRMRPNAQWEIRQFANAVGKIVERLWPRTWGLFEEYDLYGATLSRRELTELRLVMSDESKRVLDLEDKGLFKKLSRGGKEIL